MIVVNLKDGLGNQMFEFAFAKYLQKEYKERIVLNTFFFDNKKRKSFSLDCFKLGDDVTVARGFYAFLLTFSFVARLFLFFPKIMFRWVFLHVRPTGKKLFDKFSEKGLYVTFSTFSYFGFTKSKKTKKFIYGNFENHLYLEPIIEDLHSSFEFISEIDDLNLEYMNRIKQTNSVCVHIRRGDYLDPKWKALNICDFDYYQHAMQLIHSRVSDPVFYIFSNNHNEIKWIKNNYHFKYDVQYVDLSNKDFQEMRLMMSCNHFIISNSTFSWWAAYLSSNKNTCVITPTRWIDNSNNSEAFVDSDNLLLEKWIKCC